MRPADFHPRLPLGWEILPASGAIAASPLPRRRAAVLRREFGFPLLVATAGIDEGALRHRLRRLVDAEILFARGEPPAATYRCRIDEPFGHWVPKWRDTMGDDGTTPSPK